jgi:hypothetical protein
MKTSRLSELNSAQAQLIGQLESLLDVDRDQIKLAIEMMSDTSADSKMRITTFLKIIDTIKVVNERDCASEIEGEVSESTIKVICGISPDKVISLLGDISKSFDQLDETQRSTIILLKSQLQLDHDKLVSVLKIIWQARPAAERSDSNFSTSSKTVPEPKRTWRDTS